MHDENDHKTEGRILLVEDNLVFIEILSNVLDGIPIEYMAVSNGKDAVTACQNEEFALLLMDINMPEMNGIEATRQIRMLSQHYAWAPIIAVTANLTEQSTRHYLDAGMNAVVKKPISAQALYETLFNNMVLENKASILKRSKAEADKIVDSFTNEGNLVNMETVNHYYTILKGDFLPLLREYLTAGPEEINRLGEAIRLSDYKQVAFIAHKFKSTSLAFGAQTVSNLSAQIELASKQDSPADSSDIFNDLHIQFELTKAILEKRGQQLHREGKYKS